MLRWNSTNPNTKVPVLGFGIDAENVRRLQAGQPIIASVSIDGRPCQIVIHYGETIEAILEHLRDGGSLIVIPQSMDAKGSAH